MLGSLHDAEDVLQDTLLAAWQGLDGFEGRASIRTWLYRFDRSVFAWFGLPRSLPG
jgi:DNA-directed RNA polymerase specialized sigma24 family protein